MAMESPRRLQRTIEAKAAAAANKDPFSGETVELGEYERTAAQLWQDEREHPFFADFLHTKDTRKGKIVTEALETGKALTPAQGDFLEAARKEFNRRRMETEKLRSAFTVEHVQDMASVDKKISHIIGMIGPDAARDLLMDQIEKLAFQDDKKFKALTASMKAARDVAESPRGKAIDGRVRSALSRLGISEDQYASAVESSMGFAAGVSQTTKTELERHAKENMGTLMTLVDIFSLNAITRSRTRQVMDVFETQRSLLAEQNIHLSDVGRALNATIAPEMRVAMQKVMVHGGEMAKVPDTNVDTIPQMQEARKEFTDDARKKRFADALKAESRRLAAKKGIPVKRFQLSDFDDTEKDAFLDSFADSEDTLQKNKRGRGVFAAILAMIFKSKSDIRTLAASLWP